MSAEHISFDKLSDLHDDEISIQEEKDFILQHLEECIQCGGEFRRLKDTICHCIAFRNMNFCNENMSIRIMKVVRWRRRKAVFYRALPAVAASVIIIAGAGIFTSGMFNPGNSESSDSSVSASMYDATDMEQVVKILSKNNAKILQVSDLFIEGETTVEKFKKLRRDLGFRKVVYSLTNQKAQYRQSWQWKNPGIEEVGMSSKEFASASAFPDAREQEKYIRFRVFK